MYSYQNLKAIILSEFEDDYQKIEQKQKEKERQNLEKLGDVPENNQNQNDINFKEMKPYDKANIILNNILLGRDCAIGKNKILFKSGTLLNLRKKFDKLLGYYDKNKKKGKNDNQTPKTPKTQLTSLLENNSTNGNNNPNMRTSLKRNQSLKNQCDLLYIQKAKDDDIPNKNIKNKNNYELIDAGENNFSKKYNIFNIMDRSKSKGGPDSVSSNDENDDINL